MLTAKDEVRELQTELGVVRGGREPHALAEDAPDPLAETLHTLCKPAVQLLEAEMAEAKASMRPKPASVEESAAAVRLLLSRHCGSC
jgi:hypothetical protein